jgi:hypothetical protein
MTTKLLCSYNNGCGLSRSSTEMSFGRYVDLANMSEQPDVSMPAVKTQTVDYSETSVSVLSPRFKPVGCLSSVPRETQREG